MLKEQRERVETFYQIRSAYRDEWEDAMALAWKTFLQFEADVYSAAGVQNFENFITDATLHRMFIMGAYQMFVALDRQRIIGMITLRDSKHISLLFVDEKYHRQGRKRPDFLAKIKPASIRKVHVQKYKVYGFF